MLLLPLAVLLLDVCCAVEASDTAGIAVAAAVADNRELEHEKRSLAATETSWALMERLKIPKVLLVSQALSTYWPLDPLDTTVEHTGALKAIKDILPSEFKLGRMVPVA